MKRLLYIVCMLVQCTWGCVQTVIGFCFFIKFRKCKHRFFRGCIETQWDLPHVSGLSMGLFIFTPREKCDSFLSDNLTKDEISDSISRCRVHEYGHVIQSLILGPFMIIPGVISIMWGSMKRYAELRNTYGVPYDFCWVEKWANRLGEKVTGLPSIDKGI